MTSILVIDDGEHEGFAHLLGADYRHPEDVTSQKVLDADLIVIDQFLSRWKYPDNTPATMHPVGGLAVAAVLRSQMPQSCTPIVIFTGAMNELGKSIPSGVRRQALASAFGVEWVADRTDAALIDQLDNLARASEQLGHLVVGGEISLISALTWLGLEASLPWANEATRDFRECHPETAAALMDNAAMVFLRWFLHEVLPFPTFLLSDTHASLRMGLTVSGFRSALELDGNPLGERLRSVRYRGGCSEFLGDRYWRAGIDWVLSASEGWEQGALSDGEAACEISGVDLDVLGDGVFRIPVDGDLNELEAEPITNLERIVPEHWPVFADDVYALVDDIDSDERLASWRLAV